MEEAVGHIRAVHTKYASYRYPLAAYSCLLREDAYRDGFHQNLRHLWFEKAQTTIDINHSGIVILFKVPLSSFFTYFGCLSLRSCVQAFPLAGMVGVGLLLVYSVGFSLQRPLVAEHGL